MWRVQAATKLQILIYSVVLVAVSVLPVDDGLRPLGLWRRGAHLRQSGFLALAVKLYLTGQRQADEADWQDAVPAFAQPSLRCSTPRCSPIGCCWCWGGRDDRAGQARSQRRDCTRGKSAVPLPSVW